MTIPSVPHPPESDIPPLEPGDRLTRAEFERRYVAMPWLKKAADAGHERAKQELSQ